MGRKYEVSESNTTLTIKVIPRARKSKISQVLEDGTIKIRLTAPPIEGKANKALIKLLADIFRIPPSNIEIISGNKGRKKVVLLRGIQEKTAQLMIEREIVKE